MIELNLAFVIQVINFGILAIMLNFLLFRPVRKVLADRRLVIESAREKTVTVDHEVQKKMALYESRLQQAKAEASQARAEALKQAHDEESALLERARLEAVWSLEKIREQVATEADDARGALRKSAQTLSGDICEKILGRSL